MWKNCLIENFEPWVLTNLNFKKAKFEGLSKFSKHWKASFQNTKAILKTRWTYLKTLNHQSHWLLPFSLTRQCQWLLPFSLYPCPCQLKKPANWKAWKGWEACALCLELASLTGYSPCMAISPMGLATPWNPLVAMASSPRVTATANAPMELVVCMVFACTLRRK